MKNDYFDYGNVEMVDRATNDWTMAHRKIEYYPYIFIQRMKILKIVFTISVYIQFFKLSRYVNKNIRYKLCALFVKFSN